MNAQIVNNNLAKKIFDIVDDNINRIIEDGVKLSDISSLYYNSFWNNLKDISGTSSGFTGLSEYLILKTIMIYLKNTRNMNFYTINKTKDVKLFISESEDVMITHSTSINETLSSKIKSKFNIDVKWSNAIRMLPDIVIFKKMDNEFIPILILQIKCYSVSRSIIMDEIKKFNKYPLKYNPLLALLFISNPSENSISIFKKEIQKNKLSNFYLITPNEKLNSLLHLLTLIITQL